jgi:hypothetical protein
MTPTDAQLAEIEAARLAYEAAFRLHEIHQARHDYADLLIEHAPALLAALRDARAEIRKWQRIAGDWLRKLATVEAERDAALRREAELRARIEALCEHWESWIGHTARTGDGVSMTPGYVAGQLRAALSQSPAETESGPEVVHKCPGRGEAVTQCCGRTPFELPSTDRLIDVAGLVTCRAKGSER